MDCNPAVLVGKKPRRLAAQESPRCGGGAVTCTSGIGEEDRWTQNQPLQSYMSRDEVEGLSTCIWSFAPGLHDLR